MASPVASSPVLKGMVNQLAAVLNTEGEKGRKAWEDLHGKLADIASSIADPTRTIQALLKYLKEIGSIVFGYPDAEVLLRQIMGHVEEKVSPLSADASQAIPLLKALILQVADQLNMTPLRNSVHLEMIDGDTIFAEENVDYMVKYSVELSAPNAAYTVVSIVGAQSSGKSYLLNHLFRTKFPVMDPKLGRSQTTKGILMARCIEPSMLVLDIEGFDGRERGQDTLFENQAALFALTVSNIMIVNISVFDIGREQGGGQTLFKTIFQERTKLPPGLTNIVVVLRHYNGETPLEVLKQDVMKTLEEIWRSVNKESTRFIDYIEINVVGLPDKDSKDFQKEVTALRKLLTNFTRSAKVPSSSFSLSSKMLWGQIKENKNLDLPSHMMLLATLYCQRTVEACMGQFDDDVLKAEETPQGFKEVANTNLANIITQYNHETEMYDAVVRDIERQKMVDKLSKIFAEHSRELIKKIQEDTSKQFKDEFARELENMEKYDDVLNYDDHRVEACVEKFTNLCEDLKVFDLEYVLNSSVELQKQLTSHIVFHILTLKEERATKALEEQERSDQNIEELTTKLDQSTEEKLCLKEEMERVVQKFEQEKLNREKEDSERRQQTLENELEIQKERTRKIEEALAQQLTLQSVHLEERGKDERIEELIMKLDQRTEESLRNREKEDFERRQRALENELQMQRERTIRLEEQAQQKSSSSGLLGFLFG